MTRHVLELHHLGGDRCQVVCRDCGELTALATLAGGGRVIARHRRRHVLRTGLWPEWMRA